MMIYEGPHATATLNQQPRNTAYLTPEFKLEKMKDALTVYSHSVKACIRFQKWNVAFEQLANMLEHMEDRNVTFAEYAQSSIADSVLTPMLREVNQMPHSQRDTQSDTFNKPVALFHMMLESCAQEIRDEVIYEIEHKAQLLRQPS